MPLHGGKLAAKALKNAGVEVVFTLSGGHIMPLYDGCIDEVPIDPQRMCREVRDRLALGDPIVIDDGGDIVATAARIIPVKNEGAWMEYGTAVRFGLPIIGIVGNDGAWGQMMRPQGAVEIRQDREYGGGIYV